LYSDVLGDSVPRKARRRLRRLANATERVHDADVQLAWLARFGAQPAHADRITATVDGATAAEWLRARIVRRRERAVRVLQRAQSDARPLRRLAKRLGVYVTSIQLDAVSTPRTFARLTSDELVVHADALGAAMRGPHMTDDHHDLGRALRSAEYLGYLLDSIRASANVEDASRQIAAVRAALEMLAETMVVSRAIVRGGRRVAALHIGGVLHGTIWSHPVVPGLPNVDSGPSPVELQSGFIVLAEALHEDVRHGLEGVAAAWEAGGAESLIDSVTAIANQL
jgi:hypothetical protein